MAQLTQRRYTTVSDFENFDSGEMYLPGFQDAAMSPTTQYYSGTTAISGVIDTTLVGLPSSTLTGTLRNVYSNALGFAYSGNKDFFGTLPTNPLQNTLVTTTLLNTPFTSADVNSTKESIEFFNLLYKPNAQGASTNTTTGSFSDYTYTDYALQQIDRNLKLTVSADNAAAAARGYQTVAEFYRLDGGMGLKVPQGTYGAKKESDGNYYSSSAGGFERLSPRSYSLGTPTTFNGSTQIPVLATKIPSTPSYFTSQVYSSGPSNFSYTSKVYSIR